MASYRTAVITWNTTTGAKSATIAAIHRDLLVAFVGHTGITTTHAVTDNAGGTWVQVLAVLGPTSADSISVWIRTTLVSSAVSIIVTTTPSTSTGGGLSVIAVQGMTRPGLAAVRGFGSQATQAAGTPAPVLSLTPLSTSVILGFIMDVTNGSANCVPRSSPAYSERFDQGYNSPASGIEVMTLDSGETSATITWGGATPSAFSSAVIELNATDPSRYTHPIMGMGSVGFSRGGPSILVTQSFPETVGPAFLERSASCDGAGGVLVSGSPFPAHERSAAIDGLAGIEASGTSFSVIERSGSFSATGSIETSALFFSTFERNITISATGEVQTNSVTEHFRSLLLNGAGSIIATGSGLLQRSASLSAVGSIQSAAESFSTLVRAVSLDGSATVTVTGQTEQERSAALNGTGAVSAAGFKVQAEIERAGSFDGVGLIAASGQRLTDRAAAIIGTGNIATTSRRDLLRAVALEATGNISISGSIGVQHSRSASFTGQGGMTVTKTTPPPRVTINIGQENRTIAASAEDRSTNIAGESDRITQLSDQNRSTRISPDSRVL